MGQKGSCRGQWCRTVREMAQDERWLASTTHNRVVFAPTATVSWLHLHRSETAKHLGHVEAQTADCICKNQMHLSDVCRMRWGCRVSSSQARRSGRGLLMRHRVCHDWALTEGHACMMALLTICSTDWWRESRQRESSNKLCSLWLGSSLLTVKKHFA